MKKFLWVVWGLFLASQVFGADPVLEQGKTRVKLRGKSGTFSVYVKNSNGDYISLLSERDSGTSSFFSLKADSRTYRLLRAGGVSAKARKDGDSAALLYTIKDTATADVVFTPVATIPGAEEDALRVEVVITNTSASEQAFSLKGVFDTDIAEIEGPVFSTAIYPAVKSEMEFTSLLSHRWISTTGINCSVRVILAGADITSPMSAAVANKNVLASGEWNNPKHPGRSFSSFSSFNDAAMELIWNPVILRPGESRSIVLYLSMSADIASPASVVYFSEPGAGSSQGGSLSSGFSALSPEQISAAQLDPAYIEELLKRIQTLESQGDAADLNEVRALNAELDAIFSRLRR
ncbi:MAG: hypothetical protein LBR23_05785 [Spirochaetaceae bacterium]|jgi:hypothetical protein|nr:hypothetical protein [Spirochaetaceae bacterium]